MLLSFIAHHSKSGGDICFASTLGLIFLSALLMEENNMLMWESTTQTAVIPVRYKTEKGSYQSQAKKGLLYLAKKTLQGKASLWINGETDSARSGAQIASQGISHLHKKHWYGLSHCQIPMQLMRESISIHRKCDHLNLFLQAQTRRENEFLYQLK